MKLEMVRQYLSDHPYETLANAARSYGFYDEFHLGKAFKKKYGYSPKRKI
jgi:AraC-like DNA-binding protein